VEVPQGPLAEPRQERVGRTDGASYLRDPIDISGTHGPTDGWKIPVEDSPHRRCPVAVESTRSPHCIALQVATVRYSVDNRSTMTCDDAQTPWLVKGRGLLCKQGVAGSSPVVSTGEVLVSLGASLFPGGRSRRVISGGLRRWRKIAGQQAR
jgi:hypothetical protein